MTEEYGVWNSKTKKMHRTGMSENQVESLLKVHLDDCGSDTVIWLFKVKRVVGDWI